MRHRIAARDERDLTRLPHTTLREVLPQVLSRLEGVFRDRGEEVLRGWSHVIGDTFSHMTFAESFREGVLHVVVSNSPLYNLLVQYEHARLLQELRRAFPSISIKGIRFRVGTIPHA